VPVQFSCHSLDENCELRHSEWLASRGQDPREKLAHAMILACEGAASIVAYNMSFERRCIEGLAEVFPYLGAELLAISEKLVDLLPMVRNYVYHPQFHGSFSIKTVLPALVPGQGYGGLDVASGDVASLELEELILGSSELDEESLRVALLEYCKLDTYAMVELYWRLSELAKLEAD
jgi:hypothetical protein